MFIVGIESHGQHHDYSLLHNTKSIQMHIFLAITAPSSNVPVHALRDKCNKKSRRCPGDQICLPDSKGYQECRYTSHCDKGKRREPERLQPHWGEMVKVCTESVKKGKTLDPDFHKDRYCNDLFAACNNKCMAYRTAKEPCGNKNERCYPGRKCRKGRCGGCIISEIPTKQRPCCKDYGVVCAGVCVKKCKQRCSGTFDYCINVSVKKNNSVGLRGRRADTPRPF
jgi:hypothetical protein